MRLLGQNSCVGGWRQNGPMNYRFRGDVQQVFDCPHCGARSRHDFIEATLSKQIAHTYVTAPPPPSAPVVGGAGGGGGGQNAVGQQIKIVVGEVHVVFRCDACGEMTYRLLREGAGSDHPPSLAGTPRPKTIVLHQFPWKQMPESPAIPSDVATATWEAEVSTAAGAFNASATMARRALEALCIEQGATAKGTLHSKIGELRVAGKIPASLLDMAAQVKTDGNTGAHPQLGEVAREDAESLLAFLTEMLDHVYVLPARLSARRAAIGKPKAP